MLILLMLNYFTTVPFFKYVVLKTIYEILNILLNYNVHSNEANETQCFDVSETKFDYESQLISEHFPH